MKGRIEGLYDAERYGYYRVQRPGRPRMIEDDQVAAVIERTLGTTPSDAPHLSIRSMAKETSLSHTTIRRIWTAFGLQPHRGETDLLPEKARNIEA